MNAEIIREKYPVGTQIELEEMTGEPQMPCGLKSEVQYSKWRGHLVLLSNRHC